MKLNKYGIRLKNEKGEYLTIEEILSQCYTIWDKCTKRQKREIVKELLVFYKPILIKFILN
jgi:hypothetical protein